MSKEFPIYVHIFESLSTQEIQANCSEGQMIANLLSMMKIPHMYHQIESASKLRNVWRQTKETASRTTFNIIHWSGHGFNGTCGIESLNDGGLVLGDRYYMPWSLLGAFLAQIERGEGDCLCLSLSSCYGAYAYSLVSNYNYSFFDFLIASDRAVRWEDAAVAYVNMYYALRHNKPISDAVDYMNASISLSQVEQPIFRLYWGK